MREVYNASEMDKMYHLHSYSYEQGKTDIRPAQTISYFSPLTKYSISIHDNTLYIYDDSTTRLYDENMYRMITGCMEQIKPIYDQICEEWERGTGKIRPITRNYYFSKCHTYTYGLDIVDECGKQVMYVYNMTSLRTMSTSEKDFDFADSFDDSSDYDQ